jgi:SAM-dependent methyltransferase
MKRNGVPLASLADRHDLYQRSVQSPEHEAWFFNRIYRSNYKRSPVLLREDFCGTALVCCEWVKRKKDRRAYGVDIDQPTLDWGQKFNLSRLSDAARDRITLVANDARKVSGPKADIIAAQNFSFQFFKQRDELRKYFRAAYKNLAKDGVLILDMLGGPEVIEEDHEEIKKFRSYEYIWEQKTFDPITHNAKFAIHFRFPDGSEIRNAFRYDWRLWTIPEVRELLGEAGFQRADVYWEDTDSKTGEGNDTYRRRERAASDPAWVCYIVGVK